MDEQCPLFSLAPGRCEVAVCPLDPLLRIVAYDRFAKINILMGLGEAYTGIRFHPDMAGNERRIKGWLAKGVTGYSRVGEFTRDEVVAKIAACVANGCNDNLEDIRD